MKKTAFVLLVVGGALVMIFTNCNAQMMRPPQGPAVFAPLPDRPIHVVPILTGYNMGANPWFYSVPLGAYYENDQHYKLGMTIFSLLSFNYVKRPDETRVLKERYELSSALVWLFGEYKSDVVSPTTESHSSGWWTPICRYTQKNGHGRFWLLHIIPIPVR